MDTEKIIAKYGTDITKLNIANVRKWVRALRSFKYKKTEGTLYDGHHSYCALGVAARESGVPKEQISGLSTLPTETMEWLGVGSPNPDLGHHNVPYLNDSGKSFARIALAIEHYWIKPYEKFRHCFLKQKKAGAK